MGVYLFCAEQKGILFLAVTGFRDGEVHEIVRGHSGLDSFWVPIRGDARHSVSGCEPYAAIICLGAFSTYAPRSCYGPFWVRTGRACRGEKHACTGPARPSSKMSSAPNFAARRGSVEVRVSLPPSPNKFLPRRVHCLSRISLGLPLPTVCHLPCLSAMPCPAWVRGSAWARNLGVPLSDLRLLCGSIDGRGGESRNVHPKFYFHVKTLAYLLPAENRMRVYGGKTSQ